MPLVVFLSGGIVLLTQAAVAWLSRFFGLETGYAQRPIVFFLFLEAISFTAYFFAVEWVRKLPKDPAGRRGSLLWIFLIGVLCRLVFLPSHMIQETDPYRYIWDGQAVLSGANPYEFSPAEAFEHQLAPAESRSPEISATFEKINHPSVKTIYPPLAQYFFAASQWLTPWQPGGWKLMILGAEITILFLMLGFLRKLKIREEWLILYAWCPLVLKEFSNSLHLDVFAVLFLTLMIWSFASERFRLGFLALGLAAAVKLFPVILVPLAFLWTFKRHSRRAFEGVLIFVFSFSVFYLPFLGAGASLFEGLGRFAGSWQVNDSIFSWIRSGLLRSDFFDFDQIAFLSRAISGGLTLLCLVGALFWLRQKQVVTDYFKACLFILAALFFLAPTGNPWYFTWLLPFFYFSPLRSLLVFSGLVLLYYLDFYFSYKSQSYLFSYIKGIEYGFFYGFLILELLWQSSKKFQSSCPSSMSATASPNR